MSDNIKLIIEIPKSDYKAICANKEDTIIAHDTCRRIANNGIPLDSVKAEIEKKCNRINSIANFLKCPLHLHEEIQELLCEILTSIDNAESIDPNDVTRMFEGVTEWPKDAFKGWITEELLKQIRTESEE